MTGILQVGTVVQSINVKPGDVIVAKCNGMALTGEQVVRLKQQLIEAFAVQGEAPKIVVVDKNVDLTVWRPDEEPVYRRG